MCSASCARCRAEEVAHAAAKTTTATGNRALSGRHRAVGAADGPGPTPVGNGGLRRGGWVNNVNPPGNREREGLFGQSYVFLQVAEREFRRSPLGVRGHEPPE